jgi:MFS family permease
MAETQTRGAMLRTSPIVAIAPIAAVVFTAFFVIGLAMPVLPLHVHQRLGMSAFVVGLVAGCQFAASLVSRLWAGQITDSRGPKLAVILGLAAAVAGGSLYLVSLMLMRTPPLSVSLLLVGRALVGGAESLIITGAMLWAMGRVAADRSAQVIAWVGMSMFAAMAVGAPLGSLIYSRFAFAGVAIASMLAPLVALVVILPVRPLAPVRTAKAPMSAVLRAVLLPGIGFTLSGITFGSVTAFLTLYFAAREWAHGALAFSAFAVALIAARVFAGHLPDRFGGARVAVFALAIQAVGLALISIAPSSSMAIIGAVVAGAGFSLVFPSLGLEAVRRVAPANRGVAMGAYNAFLDLTLGVGSPALGLLASRAGIQSVFAASAVTALLAIPVALYLRRQPVA